MEKLQSLIFDISESIPNGKYLEIMDEMLKIHNYIKEFENGSPKETFKLEFDAFDQASEDVINSYYNEECDDWVFDYSLIATLQDYGYENDYIARNLNLFFFENSYFYCPVYDDLMLKHITKLILKRGLMIGLKMPLKALNKKPACGCPKGLKRSDGFFSK